MWQTVKQKLVHLCHICSLTDLLTDLDGEGQSGTQTSFKGLGLPQWSKMSSMSYDVGVSLISVRVIQ